MCSSASGEKTMIGLPTPGVQRNGWSRPGATRNPVPEPYPFLLAPTAVTIPWWLPFGKVPEVRPADLATELADVVRPILLDVRTSPEYATGHIEGAVNVLVTSLSGRLPYLGLQEGRPVVAICLSAHRSPPAVRVLRRAGIDARQLAGGLIAWRIASLPIVRR
jgi:rhodanese-related sulfurtransferase